jgi:hypothetical protein
VGDEGEAREAHADHQGEQWHQRVRDPATDDRAAGDRDHGDVSGDECQPRPGWLGGFRSQERTQLAHVCRSRYESRLLEAVEVHTHTVSPDTRRRSSCARHVLVMNRSEGRRENVTLLRAASAREERELAGSDKVHSGRSAVLVAYQSIRARSLVQDDVSCQSIRASEDDTDVRGRLDLDADRGGQTCGRGQWRAACIGYRP